MKSFNVLHPVSCFGQQCAVGMVLLLCLLAPLAVSVASAASAAPAASDASALQVTPDTVVVSTTYNGQDVKVSGQVDVDEEAIILLSGDNSTAEFKQQGKVGGFLWMTVGHLAISNVPGTYMIYLPKSISQWRDSEDKRWPALGIGFSSLLSKVSIEPEPEDKVTVFADFIKLKSHDGLYQLEGDAVHYHNTGDGRKNFETTLHIPAKMPLAGKYKISLLRVRDGKIIGTEESGLSMREEGFPAFIGRLAFQHSLLYGCLAVLVAIMAGLGMGLLFTDKGGAH